MPINNRRFIDKLALDLALTRKLTGTEIARAVDNSYLHIIGGSVVGGKGGLIGLNGNANAWRPGCIDFYVPNAAGNADILAGYFRGNSDTIYLDMNSHQIKSLLDPVDAQDAATKNYVDVYRTLPNILINGNCDIWQRGTSCTSDTSGYPMSVCDRWRLSASEWGVAYRACLVLARESATVPSGSKYAMKLSLDNSGVNCDQIAVQQRIEQQLVTMLAGRTVTFTVKIRRITNNDTGTLKLQMNSANNLDDWTRYPTGTGQYQTVLASLAAISNTAFDTYSATFTMPAACAANGCAVRLAFTPNSGYFTMNEDKYYIGQMSLVPGSYPPPCPIRTVAEELALCQRYYRRFTTAGSFKYFAGGYAATTTEARILIPLETPMRTIPTLETSGTANHYCITDAATSIVCNAVPAMSTASSDRCLMLQCTVAAGLTAGDVVALRDNNTSSAYLGLNSEL